MGNCESTTAGSRGITLLGGSGGGSRLTGYPSPNTAADAIIKDEPDFVETHCDWVGCDRDLHTQEQLVKVGSFTCPTYQSHEGRKRHLERPFHSKDFTKIAILHDYNPRPIDRRLDSDLFLLQSYF